MTPITREILIRHPANPVLTAAAFPWRMRAVYNSSAIKVAEGKYGMLCRANELNHCTLLWPAHSTDGITWKLRPAPSSMPDTAEWHRYAATVYSGAADTVPCVATETLADVLFACENG